MTSQQRAPWWLRLALSCLFFTAAISQASGEASLADAGTASEEPTVAPPTTTAPETTEPPTTPPTMPPTTPPTMPPTTPPTMPPTKPPTMPPTKPPTVTSPPTTPPASVTTAPTSPNPSLTAPAVTPTPSPPSSFPDTTTAVAPSPAKKTVAPVVEHYNSSTLPPGVDMSMLGDAELVAVEVTETAQGDGTTSYSYAIITRSDGTEKTIVLSPTTDSATSSSDDQSSGSLMDTANSAKTASSISTGAVIGIIVAAMVFMLVLFVFFAAQRQRSKRRASAASLDDCLESPLFGKQNWQLAFDHSPADTEGQDTTRATVNSRFSGASMPDGKQRQSTLWEDPVILASRIPIDRIESGVVISRGGFDEVYHGRYRDHDVAIKMLLPEKRKDLAHIQAFLAEVRLMATMEHPHIVQFIGVAWESLSDLRCVTEFMAGGDLRSLLKSYLASGAPQGIDASKMQIAYHVAYALTYLHSLDPVVLHRDLKSRNILLTESLNAKITDFGASRARADATMTAGVGSSLWMAPEVMMGERYGEKADVFSFGVVISELDTNDLPYSHVKERNSDHALPDTAVLQMVSAGKLRVRFSPFLDPETARFVGSCVSVDPQMRPTAAEVLYHLQMATRKQKYLSRSDD